MSETETPPTHSYSEVERLRVALAESYGSYMALVTNIAGLAKASDDERLRQLAESAPNWDGPHLARRELGIGS